MGPPEIRIRRTFSSANLEDVQKLLDARESALKVDARSPPYFAGAYAKSTFALPCLQQNPRLEEAVIDHGMRASLESRGLINWWVDGGSNLVRLYPLDTLSDGNCLLHALSLALCGTHDRRLTLRTALHATMKGEHGHIFRQRWQLVQTARNKAEGFELEQHQWDREWQTLVDRAGTPGSSLEDVHILTLAHVLSRPIIVYSSKVLEGVEGDAVAPVQVGGIYLPLEYQAQECMKEPLFLAYWNAHFVPLLTEVLLTELNLGAPKRRTREFVPIAWRDGNTFDLRFHIPQDMVDSFSGDSSVQECMDKFLTTSLISLPDKQTCCCVERDIVLEDDAGQRLCESLIRQLAHDSRDSKGQPPPLPKDKAEAQVRARRQELAAGTHIRCTASVEASEVLRLQRNEEERRRREEEERRRREELAEALRQQKEEKEAELRRMLTSRSSYVASQQVPELPQQVASRQVAARSLTCGSENAGDFSMRPENAGQSSMWLLAAQPLAAPPHQEHVSHTSLHGSSSSSWASSLAYTHGHAHTHTLFEGYAPAIPAMPPHAHPHPPHAHPHPPHAQTHAPPHSGHTPQATRWQPSPGGVPPHLLSMQPAADAQLERTIIAQPTRLAEEGDGRRPQSLAKSRAFAGGARERQQREEVPRYRAGARASPASPAGAAVQVLPLTSLHPHAHAPHPHAHAPGLTLLARQQLADGAVELADVERKARSPPPVKTLNHTSSLSNHTSRLSHTSSLSNTTSSPHPRQPVVSRTRMKQGQGVQTL